MTGKDICRQKKSYPKRKKAWMASLYYFTQLGHYQTPYKCKYCLKFHLTAKAAQPTPSQEFIEGFNKWYGKEVLTLTQ